MKDPVRLNIRIEKELRERLKVAAVKTGDTVQNIVTTLIVDHLQKLEEAGNMLKLIENNEGEKRELARGSLEAIVEYLDHAKVDGWIQEQDTDMELLNLENIEVVRDLEVELEKVNLDWWSLELEEIK